MTLVKNKMSIVVRIRTAVIINTMLLLSACASLPPIVPQTSPANTNSQTDNNTLPAGRDIEEANAFLAAGRKREAASAYFSAANNYRSPYRERLILQAAELASIFKDANLTQRYLEPVSNIPLNPENQARFRFTQAQLALNDRHYREALRLLPQRVSNLPAGLGNKILNARIKAAQASGDKLSLVQELVLQAPTLNSTHEKQLNNDRIWGHLNQLPLERLNQGRKNISHPIVKSWLNLAYIQKTNRNNETALQSKVRQWQNRNPNHPGNTKISSILAFKPVATTTPYKNSPSSTSSPEITSTTVQVPSSEKVTSGNHIAVILPLTGSLSGIGNSILAGIKNANNALSTQRQLKVYDSNSSEIKQLYQKAANNGADFILGPFNKNKLLLLSQSNLSKPTLALNYLSANSKKYHNLFQFGLLPEDEAIQIAQFALNQGKKRIAIVTPDSKWGLRLKDTLRTAVIEREGKVVINKSYPNTSNDYSYISKSISIRESEIDAILLAASPTQIQRLYPTLRQDMKNIPIYATSHVFNGIQNAGKNANLNGLVFTETPWILGNNNTTNSRYPRLYALGMDALMLINKPESLTLTNNGLNGKTGRIRLSQNGSLHRNLFLAKFKDGIAVRY